jgi:plastocyanin
MPSIPSRPHVVQAACLLAIIVSLSPESVAQQTPSTPRIEIDLVDYRFKPSIVENVVNRPTELVLKNLDTITPHDLTIEAPQSGLSIKADVGAGETVVVTIRPTTPGEFAFYCSKKLLFFPSHRERGMEGTLKVKTP